LVSTHSPDLLRRVSSGAVTINGSGRGAFQGAVDRPQPPSVVPKNAPTALAPQFGQYVLDHGLIKAAELLAAQQLALRRGIPLFDSLCALHPNHEETLARYHADWLGLPYYIGDCSDVAPDVLAGFDPQRCLRLSALPLYRRAGKLHLAVANPAEFEPKALRADLDWSDCALQYAPRSRIHAQVQAMCDTQLSLAASARVDLHESCRTWGLRPNRRTITLGSVPVAMIVCFAFWPQPTFLALTLWALLTLVLAATMKTLSLASFLTRPRTSHSVAQHSPLPHISVLVPLYKEPEVLPNLLRRLNRLDYPNALLEVLVLLEESDQITRTAMERADLPMHLRVIIVPDGTPRTKPRAMNYALDFCRGDIIGIYDAEDAPEPDQLRKVAAALHDAPDDLAGVQGILDYYNPRQNWIARCFTIEYAAWFRVMLPGMRRLGFAIPLGGTTVFCRRDVLLTLGGWDAHNVTEDADLGIRLARHGYRIEMLASTTFEEATCRPLSWVRQRSRWLKGYIATYLVHMRSPRQLLHQLGVWQFCGVQLHFVTALSQFFLAPLLWSFWILPLGFGHPLQSVAPAPLLQAVVVGFIVVECLTFAVAITACHPRERRYLLPWVPTLHLYFPMAVFAAYKASIELIIAPFYWDKTQHGHAQDTADMSDQTPIRLQAGSAQPADVT
jgi:cellulose synthase/poly-beta-1,6-N-acetylglucosamine synthase-like glycosyltransferase